ncbi:MAG TPA: SH3 domain-containing protein [Anaerolineales bacterium]|nr:SH3 domain-containing protein [Anaerolineales bacterium]
MSKHFLLILVLFLASCAPKSTSATPQPTQPPSVKASLNTQSSPPTSIPEIKVGVVVVNSLNVRQGPGVNFMAVGSLNKGEKFYILGETMNSTNNKWLLVSLPDSSIGWVTGDQSYVTVQMETVDSDTYSTWQKNMEAAKSASLIPVTSP